MDGEARDFLKTCSWPGNIRELPTRPASSPKGEMQRWDGVRGKPRTHRLRTGESH